MKSADIRRTFLEFFQEHGHEIVPSSPLVPGNDPTLLFTNAGMVQFKDVFTGREQRSYQRAVTSQRCVRAGGKHNDLENVGYTARHHTFFEMLGNFSFGDYFKHDAIRFAWTLLTERFGLPAEKLWVTVHDSDDEAEQIWRDEIGVPADRITRMGDKDNFWSMGDTGPCGPCSEIFYDHGPDVWGGPPGTPEEDGDRYVEIWNLVFMQFERSADGTMTPLPRPSVDTGMGLERVAAVLQGVHSNYEIDLFQALIAAAAQATGAEAANPDQLPSLRVIADHIRSAAFLVTDGVVPSNEGRGYVLRRIIRRALRHGHKLGCERAFFHHLVAPLAQEMGAAHEALAAQQARVAQILEQEEAQFARTLAQGMTVLEGELATLSGKEIPGDVVFKLYDTYGFPVDLTADIARERDLTLDEAGFEAAMADQRARARSASRFAAATEAELEVAGQVEFRGYEVPTAQGAVTGLFRRTEAGLEPVEALEAGAPGAVVLDQTPFYAESGGQIGDQGELRGSAAVFAVEDTRKAGAQHLHLGTLSGGALALGDRLEAHIDRARRQAIALNHSATHLLHAALRELLGQHVEQRGSLVTAERLRFDFAHHDAIDRAVLDQIEDRVNAVIWSNSPVQTRVMSFDAARDAGAMALFGEKYGDEVRVLSMAGDFSVELCGGTHVTQTGDIGLLRIVSEQGIASGVRRIEAVTGPAAHAYLRDADVALRSAAGRLKVSREQVLERMEGLLTQQKALERKIDELEQKLAQEAGADLAAGAVEVGGLRVLAATLPSGGAKALLPALDQLKARLAPAAVVLAAVEEGVVSLAAGVSADWAKRLPAGPLVQHVGAQVGAKGGGRPELARAGGGNQPEALEAALASVAAYVAERLS